MGLPARKVFPIQLGDRLFRLSGASISSDAPSYFSQFFEEQIRTNEGSESCRTLYIDRDPATFEDIALHLQGYHVEPRDGAHFVKLFADAQYFCLPRLTALLCSSTIYARVGEQEFRISKDFFNSPGDSPNYFSLGFSSFFTTPEDRDPGCSQQMLLRPPSLLPPSVPTRSAQVFADLLQLLQGYQIYIRNDHHRNQLLRDARYYHFKGLEQRLIPHQILFDAVRQKTEILLRLEDIQPSGLAVVMDNVEMFTPCTSPDSAAPSDFCVRSGLIHYQRPYVDAEAHDLVLEFGEEFSMTLDLKLASTTGAGFHWSWAAFHNQTPSDFSRLVATVLAKMNLRQAQWAEPMTVDGSSTSKSPWSSLHDLSERNRMTKVRIGPEAHVVIDGRAWPPNSIPSNSISPNTHNVPDEPSNAKWRGQDLGNTSDSCEMMVRKAQWRLIVLWATDCTAQPDTMEAEVVLDAVKIEAFWNERSRNAARSFLA
ncbi:Putative SKP1/BTB/POZ domain superfamily protein [Septoria linicola]|uniref:SKP1/BTB/POZ domain superfamily protein n=1 Tax=Septoria linicola TaxID=215465 RepID=A0A9Q9EHD9_9PEZI|nr:putative SKP1/BTB/POZ domain superfamily protein [Septoria linicola]USW49904.1 Putative SKP1/BTB/POZ domain superfamily protein [Septoria linicola]